MIYTYLAAQDVSMNRRTQFFCILLFVSWTLSTTAQSHPSCDGQRYFTEVFTEVQCTKSVKFGEGLTIGGEMQELFMDVYEPVGDAATKRPVIFLAFGGSYIGGSRDEIDWLCEQYARRGFVAASIDYRLYDLPLIPLPTEIEITEVVIKSISDMKAAIRHLRQDADTDNIFRIDPEFVFVGGISAGAITAAHTAFLDSTDVISEEIMQLIEENGGYEGNTSDNYQYSSSVKALVNYSGGLANKEWIDAEDPSFISFHDENDPVVPYEDDFAKIFGFDIIFMSGSKSCTDQANAVGVQTDLHTIDNSFVHVSYLFNDEDIAEVMDTSSFFLAEIICGPILSNINNTEIQGLQIFPNPSTDLVKIQHATNNELEIQIVDSYGKLIVQKQNVRSIHVRDLAPALYFFVIREQKTGKTSKVKFVKI